MEQVDYHSTVGEALTTLVDGLSPFVDEVLAGMLPPGAAWPDLLRAKDFAAGRRVGEYRSRDLALLLRAMTERLGDLGFPFSRQLPRQAQTYASELREVRNRWAHTESFTADQARRAVETAELLLRDIGASDHADRLAELKPATTAGRHAKPEPLEPLAAAPEAGITPRIEIHAVADLSYPMAHCRIPVIDHIAIDNTGDELRGAVLELDVTSAAGSHGGPRQIHLDLAAHAPTILRDVDLLLDPASMLTVDEPRPAKVRAVLHDPSGATRAQVDKDVTILAGNQWKANPPQLALEMLAAHVQPNAAAITRLMPKVSDRLMALTGNSAIDGYQSDNPQRADAIAQAVYEAMAANDIRYAEPPASWGLDGQKIRTPAEVLDGRLGTCLDTTLTMAAALEQAGINASLWVLNGHAFLGYWRQDSALGAVSTTEVVDVVNLVDLDQIRLVETTLLTGGENAKPFADALAAPKAKHLAGDLSEILGVTDIRRARGARIFPLPSHAVDTSGNVTITEYQPAVGPVIAPYTRTETAGRADTDAVHPVPQRVSGSGRTRCWT